MIKVLELFAGVGAFSKALERLGIEHEIVDAVEIDKDAIKSFNAIHGTKFEAQDISKWDKDVEVDVIMHGSPCQDFSAAGKQAGGDEGSGTRSSLMYETLRIVKKLKPKYVIWENVPNLLSAKHRPNFERYQHEMALMGYTNTAQVLNSADFGSAQARRRVFTVSILNANKPFPYLDPTDTSKRFKDVMEKDVPEEYYLTPSKMAKINQWKSQQQPFEKVMGDESVVPTLTARGAGEEHSGMVTYSPELKETTDLKHKVAEMAIAKGLVKEGDVINTPYAKRRIDEMEQTGEIKISNKSNPDKMVTITTRPDTMAMTVAEQACTQALEKGLVKEGDSIDHTYAQARYDEVQEGRIKINNKSRPGVAPTLTTRSEPCSMAVDDGELRIRKITPLEAWRLMGFDDEDYNRVKATGASRAKLYKQAGNSIVVNVLEEIAKVLFSDC